MLCLPSRRTLRDYRNAIRPQTGFNFQIIEELINMTLNLEGHQRFICLSFDEMKIESGLVFNKYTGQIIGFTDLGDTDINEAALETEKSVATHALLFIIRGISCDLKFPLAYFASEVLLSTQIMALFWRCVAILEINCNLWVIAAVCDGASTNRKFFSLHKGLDGNSHTDVVYRTKNVFILNRFIYFFSDPPHLLKTARNCLLNSGSALCSRYMWNNDKHLIWKHICDIYNRDLESGLKLVPKLSNEHIRLSSYSKMKVKLSVQVLSDTVASVLENFCLPEYHGTAEYCKKLDILFDCANVRSLDEFKNKRKPFLQPYKLINDSRFEWLFDFLVYLKQ